jgi:uncharacterized protein YukE
MEDKKRLAILIQHWIEHNESHQEEYKKWAQRAEELGLFLVKTKIKEAMESLDQCNLSLKEALRSL